MRFRTNTIPPDRLIRARMPSERYRAECFYRREGGNGQQLLRVGNERQRRRTS